MRRSIHVQIDRLKESYCEQFLKEKKARDISTRRRANTFVLDVNQQCYIYTHKSILTI